MEAVNPLLLLLLTFLMKNILDALILLYDMYYCCTVRHGCLLVLISFKLTFGGVFVGYTLLIGRAVSTIILALA